MTLAIGDKLYTQNTSPPDALGVGWIRVTRREVLAIDGSAVTVSAAAESMFPDHSAPEIIDWQPIPGDIPLTISAAEAETRHLSELDMPAPYVFVDEDATRQAWLGYINHRYVNQDRVRRAPQPADALQAFQFHVLEWRDGLPHPSTG